VYYQWFQYITGLFFINQAILGYKQKTPLMQGLSSIKVRRGRDSNSRYGYKPHTHLAGWFPTGPRNQPVYL